MQRVFSPFQHLLTYAFLGLLTAGFIVWLSIHTPWYGLKIQALPDQPILLLSVNGHTEVQGLRLPAPLLAIDDLTLNHYDFAEEPDVFTSYSLLHDFLSRQQQFYQKMQSGQLNLTLQQNDQLQQLKLHPQANRPINTLPFTFWLQIITGLGSLIVGCWILVLRPGDIAARSFMLTGLALMVASFPAAIYSARELALSARSFQILMSLNHIGSVGFAFALFALFLYHPQNLVSKRWGQVLLVLFGMWMFSDWLQLGRSPQDTTYLPILFFSLLIIVAIFVQWHHSKGNPRAVSNLRWLGLSTLFIIFIFASLQAIPALFDVSIFLPQGVVFVFFLILYVSFALGLRGTQLFNLDRWAFHVLLWVAAGLFLIGFDLLLFSFLNFQQDSSLLLSLLICGFVYIPLRGWLWHKLVERPALNSRIMFNHIVEISLAPSKEKYNERWLELLKILYNPSLIEPLNHNVEAEIINNGHGLVVPKVLYSPAYRLVLAEQGRRLFTPHDITLLNEALDMLNYANENRNASESGAQQERYRIAQDLHDDLGSRLLTALHLQKPEDIQETISLALADMRGIVRGLAGKALPLEQIFSELKEECRQRCDSAGIEIDWPVLLLDDPINLDYQNYRHLLSAIRELFSNIIRHAQASRIQVEIDVQNGRLVMKINDNGNGFDGSAKATGLGLSTIKRRLDLLKGELQFQPSTTGTLTILSMPLPS